MMKQQASKPNRICGTVALLTWGNIRWQVPWNDVAAGEWPQRPWQFHQLRGLAVHDFVRGHIDADEVLLQEEVD